MPGGIEPGRPFAPDERLRGTLERASAAGAPVRVDLDQSLLEAKLSVPRARPGLVSRAEIIDATRGAGGQGLTCLG